MDLCDRSCRNRRGLKEKGEKERRNEPPRQSFRAPSTICILEQVRGLTHYWWMSKEWEKRRLIWKPCIILMLFAQICACTIGRRQVSRLRAGSLYFVSILRKIQSERSLMHLPVCKRLCKFRAAILSTRSLWRRLSGRTGLLFGNSWQCIERPPMILIPQEARCR